MKNNLWSFGCSFTAEYHPLDNTPPNNYDRYKEYRGGNLPPVWPTILSDKLGLENKNRGIGATSNYKIFYQFCNFCSEIEDGDVVVVGWTHPYRFILANDTHLQDILPSVTYNEFDNKVLDYIFVNRSNQTWFQEIYHFTQIINEMCREKGATVFYWSFHDEILSYVSSMYNEKNDNQFIFGKDGKSIMDTLRSGIEHIANISEETNGVVIDSHFGEYGHESQAEYFYNFIKNKI